MIDELVNAAKAMQNAGISAMDWHPKLKPLPKVTSKKPCVRIWLTNDGRIDDLELLEPEHAAQLRKFEPCNGQSFPGFNVRSLYIKSLPDGSGKDASKELEKQIKSKDIDWDKELSDATDLWGEGTTTISKISYIFCNVSKSLKDMCSSDNGLDPSETLGRLFEIVSKMDAKQFRDDYFEKVKAKVLEDLEGKWPLSLLIFLGKEGKEDTFSVFLDVKDYVEFPVAHDKTIKRLNTLMIGGVSEENSSTEGGDTDAYGLNATPESMGEKFPEVKLPFLGGVILRSQVKAIPAQSRYGQCEADTFRVGDESRKRTKRALEWLSDREREGKTYGIAGDKELLFAYPHTLPQKEIPLALLFGAQPQGGSNQQKGSFEREDSFERLAKSVIEQLKGLGNKNAKAELKIFSLRKMDKARTKVVYYRNVTVVSLEQASKAWDAGCQNIPELDVRDWSKDINEETGKSYPIPVKVRTVFPIMLYRYLNEIWKLDGQRANTNMSKVSVFTPTDGLRLMLDKSNEALAAHMLAHFVRNSRGYFLKLCSGTGKNEVTSLPNKDYYPGILGLLLFFLGEKKEVFMRECAFLLGRCLRVADEIHRLYCEIVRKGEFPSQLCGSSMLVGMMESPATSLSQLAMRSAPYVKWARAYHGENKPKLVYYWMGQWSEVADQLHQLEWPRRLTPEARAQLFLGYLASFPKSDKSANTDQVNAESITEGEQR